MLKRLLPYVLVIAFTTNSFAQKETIPYLKTNGTYRLDSACMDSNLVVPAFGSAGNLFVITQDDTITEISACLHDNCPTGEFFHGVIYTQMGGQLIYTEQSGDHLISAGEPGTAIILPLATPLVVSTGDSIWATVGVPPPSVIELGVSGTSPAGHSIYFTGGGQTFINETPMVRMGIDTVCHCTAVGLTETPQTTPIFSVYPQPANDMLNIELKSDVANEIVLELIDLNGRSLRTLKSQAPHPLIHVYVSDIPQGVYVLRSGHFSQRILVMH